MDSNTSPSGKKLSVIWNPPLRNLKRYQEGRVSSVQEAIHLITFLMRKGVRTICFTKSRRVCELLLKETQSALKEEYPDFVERIHSYRSGYSPEDRRHIEGQLFRGELLCIIATNALELGVDIGSLDCVIHLGFPHNIASFRQQVNTIAYSIILASHSYGMDTSLVALGVENETLCLSWLQRATT